MRYSPDGLRKDLKKKDDPQCGSSNQHSRVPDCEGDSGQAPDYSVRKFTPIMTRRPA
jgi:hypothetical protein